MKLQYRGETYDYSPSLMDEGDFERRGAGQYRGHRIEFAYPRHVPVPQTIAQLQYRGAYYCVNASGEVQAIAPSAHSLSDVSNLTMRSPMKDRKAVLTEVAKTHRQNIQRSLQHRLDVARAQGDSALVSQLEAEMQQFA